MTPYVLALLGTFVSVFLKGFQHKNVIRNAHALTMATSYAMAFADVLLVGLISKSDWTIAFASGTGAAFGMVAAMKAHDRLHQ